MYATRQSFDPGKTSFLIFWDISFFFTLKFQRQEIANSTEEKLQSFRFVMVPEM